MSSKTVTISKAEYDRLTSEVRDSQQRQAMEIAALEKRYQERIAALEDTNAKLEEIARMRNAERTGFEAHMGGGNE